MGVASAWCSPIFPGGVLSRQHGQDTRVVAAGWLGLCSRNCQTLDRDGFLPPRAGWGAPWGFTALEPPADERDLGWMFFIFYFLFLEGQSGDSLPAWARGPWALKVRREKDKGKPGFN